MRQIRATALVALAALLIVVLTPAAARADATLFLGTTTSPANRTARGVAIGAGLLVIGFEFEYSDTTDDIASGSPSLKTGTGNLLLQSPVSLVGIQPYFEVGGGIYREALDAAITTPGAVNVSNTGFTGDVGGGLKISLIGPIRLRVDYRVFTLKNGPLVSPVHRVYAGLNLKF